MRIQQHSAHKRHLLQNSCWFWCEYKSTSNHSNQFQTRANTMKKVNIYVTDCMLCVFWLCRFMEIGTNNAQFSTIVEEKKHNKLFKFQWEISKASISWTQSCQRISDNFSILLRSSIALHLCRKSPVSFLHDLDKCVPKERHSANRHHKEGSGTQEQKFICLWIFLRLIVC